ncbi:hypothetical protein TL08_14145 [Actinoalloteichus hymeniacidonis]|uniref:Uncharacterized protein n=1 Tax=Actinoalloteichus hymeniacidonis TaxID=340345 RepID=A0AAC9MXT0_9PSEU|nr:hypothetical protein TL08_14145 [Actinoalloteichus hymeniacidonis]
MTTQETSEGSIAAGDGAAGGDVTDPKAHECNYPGCQRPVRRAGGPGRPSEYCDLAEHTRWRAWRERQRQAQSAPPAGINVTVTKQAGPVTAAKIRADDLLTEFRSLANQVSQTMTQAVAELNTLADPGVAEEQIQTVQAEAARRIAEAESSVAEAERRRRAAETGKGAAVEAAEDAATSAEAAERDAEAAREELAALRVRAEESIRQAALDTEAARNEAEVSIAAARRQAEERIEGIHEQAVRDTENARRSAAQEVSDLRRAAAEEVSAERSAREHAAVRAERAEVSAQRAEQATQDARAELDRVRAELVEVRRAAALDVERLRSEAADQRADLLRAAEDARAAADQRLSALEEVRTLALARAERAEAQVDSLTEQLRAQRGGS